MNLDMELIMNERWHPRTGGLLDHTNDDLAEDPFMQVPDQEA